MIIKRGTRVEITMDILVPIDCTEEQLADWIYFETNYTGILPAKNPLNVKELEAIECSYDIQEFDEDDLKELEENE